jgi:hypothetical protein
MDPRELRLWLMAKPKPSRVRILNPDGEQQYVAIPENGVKWVDLANSIWALQPEAIEALDDKHQLLRAIRPSEQAEDNPIDNMSLAQDPENARLITFANLVAEAYKDSREFTAMAFDKLGELFQAVVAKANSQEKTISALDRMVQKLMLEKVAEGGVNEDGSPLTLETLLQGMIQGKMQAEVDHAARAAKEAVTNGTTPAPSAPKEGKKK